MIIDVGDIRQLRGGKSHRIVQVGDYRAEEDGEQYARMAA